MEGRRGRRIGRSHGLDSEVTKEEVAWGAASKARTGGTHDGERGGGHVHDCREDQEAAAVGVGKDGRGESGGGGGGEHAAGIAVAMHGRAGRGVRLCAVHAHGHGHVGAAAGRAAIHRRVTAAGSLAASAVREDGLRGECKGEEQGDELEPLLHGLS